MSRGVRTAVIGSVFAVMVGGAGYGAFNIVSALDGDGGGSGSSGPAPVRTGPPSSGEIKQTSAKFFTAWEQGKAAEAATYTNNDAAAEPLLTAYGQDAHITGVKITPGTASGATIPFTVRATVSYEGRSKPLTYKSELTVVRGKTTGRALVDWQPSVVHPQLRKGDTLVTGESANPEIEAVDRGGAVLTKEKYPSLGPILDELRAKYGETSGGTPGVELSVRHEAEGSADTTLLTLAKGRPGKLRTTLSASAQAAAETAVRKYAESSVVALKPSTGEVLAVANHREDGFNAAFLGKLAPGSTMKIISAATLIDNGITSMNGPAPCPNEAVWQSQTFHNLKGMQPNGKATLSESFARSCNTAFVKYADEVKVDSLTNEAQNRFGLGRDNWKTGIPSFDGSVPASGGPDTAANMIGQGQVQLSPLNMASVTATAMTGAFRQPVIVSPKLDDRELATAQGLSAGTVAQLRAMMNRTATSGTAAGVMAGLSGTVGAKTGSAEVDGQSRSNSWFTGYRNDIAAAAMTQDGGHGIDAAGPIVAAVLRSGG
ncbi:MULTISPECIES: penicillin-binding transpeptidase domain-containing protein [unclassified Streptomyces]|uniref:penicillin-binding transpeptidase domain-containing protein n=1 Tax=unclassified Streptomyces TaxID=2593676 RepID=UPI00224DAC1C|nr:MULTISPECIES: penicillin-binding transpeptidase domain-containing protein [unclassified Streptomyces]MCX4881344.1 penicillin-binding transpeptidase domain-containing protein [Streptomyces sp. NBC_00847]MCX5421394.1 penicillin-binding transpeptidase domain-containing protein [Streptomyces sp. NBC_00078]